MSDTYELEIDVAAPAERVWRALTDSRELEAWFCEHADVSLDDKRYDFWGRFTPGVPAREDGRHDVVEREDGRTLRYRWRYLGGDTVVTITIDGRGDRSTVHVLHEDVPERPRGGSHHPRHLWSNALTQLRAWLEVGRPGPRFDWSWPHVGEIRVEAEIEGSSADVWQALLEDWGQVPARVGGEGTIDVGHVVGLKVLDLEPRDRLVLEWNESASPTVMTYTLRESGGRTRITLVHSGFGDADVQGMAEGFFSGLYQIAFRVETGGAWPPLPERVLQTDFPQSGGRFGVRVLQTGWPD